MTADDAVKKARGLLGANWDGDKVTAAKEGRSWIVRINGRIWMSLADMEESGQMRDKEEE